MYNNAVKVPINVKFQFRLKFKNNSLILFWIKDKKKVVPKARITPGNAYPLPAIVAKKENFLQPLSLWVKYR